MDLDIDAKKPAIRLFCTSADSSWCLQIRAHEKLANGQQGQKFLIAGATLDRETMLSLRDAINAQLEEYAEFREPEPRSTSARRARQAQQRELGIAKQKRSRT
jgi:hypothetical protein